MTFSPLTLFCLLPRVAARPRRGQRRSPASGFPGARCGGSPERSGDRPALPHRPAAAPGQQRCRRSPHGKTQAAGGGGRGAGGVRGTGTRTWGIMRPGEGREVEVRVSPRQWPLRDAALWNLSEPKAAATKEDSWRGPLTSPPEPAHPCAPLPRNFLLVAFLLSSLPTTPPFLFRPCFLELLFPDPINIPAPPPPCWVVGIYRNRYVLGDSQAVLPGRSMPQRASRAWLYPAGSTDNCPPRVEACFTSATGLSTAEIVININKNKSRSSSQNNAPPL